MSTPFSADIVQANENLGVRTVNPIANLSLAGEVSASGTFDKATMGIQPVEALTTSFYYKDVIRIDGVTSITQLSQIAASATPNGMLMLIKVTLVGHTGSQGSGGFINEYVWDSANGLILKRTLSLGPTAPTLTVAVASDILTVKLSSSDGTNQFKGLCVIEYFAPIDFTGTAWTVS